MVDVTKKDLEEVGTAFEEFKKTNDLRLAEIEKKGGADPLTAEKLAKVEAKLDQYEDLNQKLTQAQLKAQKAEDAVDELLVKFNRPGMGGGVESKEQRFKEMKAKANSWLRAAHSATVRGEVNLSEAERKSLDEARAEYKALLLTDDTGGGYLAPSEFVAEILKTVVLISPVRALARIRQTGMKSVILPKRVGLTSAVWASEADTRTAQTTLGYGALEIHTHELYGIIDVSNQNLEDSAFDLAAEVLGEVSEQFAVAEGLGFVSGSGVGKPEGFLVNKDTIAAGNVTKTGDANLVTADGVITTYHDLKTAYARNAVWTQNRKTLGAVRKLKDGEGDYLFLAGLANGMPNTILGAPYVETPDMPDVAAGAYPMAFGDFQRGYSLVDRIDIAMLRDPFTQATSGNVRYFFRKRLGGQVTMPEAIRPMLVSV